MLGACVRTTLNPTMLSAGFKHNVVPSQAVAGLDIRYLPGTRDQVLERVLSILPPGAELEFQHDDIAVETPFDGGVADAIVSVLGSATRTLWSSPTS